MSYYVEWEGMYLTDEEFMGGSDSRSARLEYAKRFEFEDSAQARVDEISSFRKCTNIRIVRDA